MSLLQQHNNDKLKRIAAKKAALRVHIMRTFIFVGAAIVGLVLVILYIQDNPEQRIYEKAAKDPIYDYKDFFHPRPIKYMALDMPLVIRGTEWGQKFWDKDFPSMIAKAELAVQEMLDIGKEINRLDKNDKHHTVSLADYPDVWDIIVMAKEMSGPDGYNLAAGEINLFWERALGRSGKLQAAILNTELYKKDLIGKSEITEEKRKEIEEKLAKLNQVISTVTVLPDMNNIRDFISFAKLEYISLDQEKKTVTLTNPNVAIDLSFFSESYFLQQLKKQMPEGMRYIIYLGSRHGIWYLDKKYVRFSVALTTPYDVFDPQRAGLKLLPETGYFVTTRRKENYFKYNDTVYELPVDWRTGLPAKETIAALVVDEASGIRASILSYSLFTGKEKQWKRIAADFPADPFLVLQNDEKVYVDPAWQSIYISRESLENMKKKKGAEEPEK